MSNRFGINSATNAGDGNTLNVADATENTENPKPFTGISFNSVVSSSFNEALTNADQMLKTEQAKPKPDNSTFLSVSGNVIGGFAGGMADQVTSIFRKDKATLAREADQGGISALTPGAGISASFTRTAGEVAHAVPALNPFSAQGRNNWSVLANKTAQDWNNGTADQKAHMFGTGASFLATLAAGTTLTTKSAVSAVNDLRGGTIATRALTVTERVGVATDELANASRTIARVGETGVANSSHVFSPAIEGATLTQRVSTGFSRLTDAVGLNVGKAETVSVAGTEGAVNVERGFASRLSPFFANVKPSTVGSEALTSASKVIATDATKDFTSFLERLAPKGANESAAIQQVKAATEALATGNPEAKVNFLKAIEGTGVHAEELTGRGNALLRTLENTTSIERLGVTVDTAARDIGTKIETLSSGLAKGSPEARALQNIQKLASDVTRDSSKTEELIQAIKALKQDAPALNPQLLDGLVADVSKFEGATAGRRLLTTFEGSVEDLNQAVAQIGKSVDSGAAKLMTNSPEQLAVRNIQTAAQDLARGAISPEQFTRTVEELKKFPSINPEIVTAITQDAAKVVERANVSNLFRGMDDLIQPVRQASNGLDKVLVDVKAAHPELAAEQVTKVEQAVADFVAGRSGNSEELTAAVRQLTANKAIGTEAAEKLTTQVNQLVESVEKARPALVMERSISESAPILEQAAAKFAGTPQAKAIEEVQQAFSGAIKGNVTADELAQTISRNSKVLERFAPGTTEALTVNGTKIADAAADSTRALAIRNGLNDISNVSNDLVKVTQRLESQVVRGTEKAETQIQALKQIEEAATGIKNGTKTVEDLKVAVQAARDAEIPFNFTRHVDDLAVATERVPRLQAIEASVAKTRQATSGIAATTDLMEAAVRQGDQFKAIDELRRAVRTGNAEEIAAAINKSEKGLAELEKVQPGITKELMADAAKVSEAGSSNRALTRITNTLDEAEIAAKRSSSEFRAIEDVRAAARRVAADGVTEDLAAAIQKNKTQLESMQAKVAEMEAKAAGTETRTTSLVEKLNSDARLLGDETANVRRLTTVENNSRSLSNVVENLAPKLEDPARLATYKARNAGDELINDIKQLSAKTEDAALKRSLEAKAAELEAAGGAFNPARERLNVIKTMSEDVAKTTDAAKLAAKQEDLLAFVQKSSTRLEDIAKGTTAAVESKVTAIADTQKLAAAETAITKVRNLPNLADEAANLGFKANSEVRNVATEFGLTVQKFGKGEATIADVNAAAQKVSQFKPVVALSETEARNLSTLQKTAKDIEAAAIDMQKTRAAAFESQFKALTESMNSRNIGSYNTALNHIADMYPISTPDVQRKLLQLRESILDQQAYRIVQEQGFYGSRTIAQNAFGTATGGSPFMLGIQNGTINTRPVSGLVTNKGQLLDAIERVNNDIAANQLKFSVRGLTQDRAALLANPSLAQEAMQRKLLIDIAKTVGYGGATYFGPISTLKGKAQDIVYDELNAPYKIAEWMEREIAAKTDADRERYRAELATMVADYIRGKDQSQIDALREQIKKIIAERTSENPAAQAVWSRRNQELTVGQIRAKKDHDNQVQYGNAHGPLKGPGAVAAQESVSPVYTAPQTRVRATTSASIDEGANKRKPATTNFDIGKIRDMSNNIAYSQSGLRGSQFSTNGPNTIGPYTAGSSKPWQNVVAWSSGRKYTTGSEQNGKHAYGDFKQLENHPENDQGGVGAGTVAQAAANTNDPAAALQLASQQQQQAAQDEQKNTASV